MADWYEPEEVRPVPPEEPEGEREARRAAGLSRGTWQALRGEKVTLRDYERALKQDQERQRAERRGKR